MKDNDDLGKITAKLVSNGILTEEEFYKGFIFPIVLVDITGFINSELLIKLRKENDLKFSTKSYISDINKELNKINKVLISTFSKDNFYKLLDFSDYFLDEIRGILISDYRFLIRKGNSRSDSLSLLMKRLCDISEELETSYMKMLMRKGCIKEYNKFLMNSRLTIQSRIKNMISKDCKMVNHKFSNLTNKIKSGIDINYEKIKRSSSINLQKY